MVIKMYDCIVVGGGHAGAEACLASSRLGLKTLLVTGNIKMISSMPCNPSIGGPAKGIVVREIDALGGEMGRCADKASIQMKMLNMSKGPAVRALRAQGDKVDYPLAMQKTILNQENLDVIEAYVKNLLIDDKVVHGVVLEDGRSYEAKAVILTTGTYLRSRILRGHKTKVEGPDGQKASFGISEQLVEEGLDLMRLKTGTPQRVKRDSIDFSKTSLEPGDDIPWLFSFDKIHYHDVSSQVPCYLTYTNARTHEIIRANLDKSAMYGGVVEGVGPRYCPSIEDKVVRFSDKERHQIFLEPESVHNDSIYIQGFSTSMPEEIQDLMIRTLPGLENCEILRYAYAIEYDAFNPMDLKPTLESKILKNLFLAGQINGTSGYEEAACQGLMAGINASLKIKGEEPLILKRNEAYIGVLIDDLITKGTKEPYRLLTSRSEFRLLLRNDNADIRLREYGHRVGLVNDGEYNKFLVKLAKIDELKSLLETTKISPSKENNEFLALHNSSPLVEGVKAIEIVKRPEIDYLILKDFLNLDYDDDVIEQAEIQIKYEGYINKAYKQASKMLEMEAHRIPEDIDYKDVPNLALEAREKLMKVRPLTIGQATRISGVNPADIAVLMIYLERNKRR